MNDKENMIKYTLSKLNLEESMMNRKIYELSGGEQQRITIAKLLLKNLNIILADEPTASLDYENKKNVLRYLRDFANNGKTVIVVSHDREVANFSDICIDLKLLKES